MWFSKEAKLKAECNKKAMQDPEMQMLMFNLEKEHQKQKSGGDLNE